ncbi:TPA: heme ABC transporter substrate-binding protein IsdE [Streptococcus pyogenes]|uniref:High-affinity heme uptake system protein IsdE n=3 Tax=Streptococcus pyogenes TaxID=1314 RepID=A0A5S4TWI6_STRPY|nr:heme ABC transporter substrate-binding protein IsdE [Streptococcus pyogenes]AAM80167.1 putative ferrichrome ABC transporter (ferrichrome-binding protein) [Streptococcus pyogenes MGAS315]EZK56332.1 heme ABC transporter, heme-binding protein isdE [Streptococcus pyogenes ABC020052558]EZK56908.1 heme ABC transporter, heme-binding protein isdE [Streptococcus pyogenes ABC020060793]EZK61299.1 heme ABC transporter, heme-binding protein isdE [Streptococcus pyogenes ABC020048541]EZK64449.1 heme ABC t
MTKVVIKQLLQVIVVFMISLSTMTNLVYADKGQIYGCIIQRNYRHPISGQIEDSGGEHSFDIGQGMVEGTVYSDAMLEVSDAGKIVLTFRMSLADYSGNYQFWIQPGGTGSFQAVDYNITQKGTDTNGTTLDIAISLPTVNSIIRGSMFVEPMGREVVFYLSASELIQKYSGNMLAQLVTETDNSQNQEVKDSQKPVDTKLGESQDESHTGAMITQNKPKANSSNNKSLSDKKILPSKMGLTTSLELKKEDKFRSKKDLSIMIYYFPTFFLMLGGFAVWVWKKRKKMIKRCKGIGLVLMAFFLVACVNQHPKTAKETEQQRIVATSVAVVDICDRLNLDLVGVCDSKLYTLPKRYDAVKRVGLPMNPDIELIASLKPTWILSPNSLQEDLEPKYQKLDTEYGFLNLRSVEGMYQSIDDLGNLFQRQQEAKELRQQYQDYYRAFQAKRKGKKKPKVLILMGLPGSYLVATNQSYVGNLLDLAGGENVYQSDEKEFLSVNPEDMLAKEPDLILRTAHAIPDKVKVMFDKEFAENDIWKHFTAVKEGKVYDLDNTLFGMSAKLNYPEALDTLTQLFDHVGDHP